MFDSSDVIYSFTREMALKEGVLVDVTDIAKRVGFQYPVAVTSTLWEYVKWIGNVNYFQTRMLCLLQHAVLNAKNTKSDIMFFQVNFGVEKCLEVRGVIGPGDDPSPVLTFMLKDED